MVSLTNTIGFYFLSERVIFANYEQGHVTLATVNIYVFFLIFLAHVRYEWEWIKYNQSFFLIHVHSENVNTVHVVASVYHTTHTLH